MRTATIKRINGNLVEFEIPCKHCNKVLKSDIDFYGLKLNHCFNCCGEYQFFQIKLNKEHAHMLQKYKEKEEKDNVRTSN